MSGVQPMHPSQAYGHDQPRHGQPPGPPSPPTKRPNNPYGAKGTPKCTYCRRRKQKCQFEVQGDENTTSITICEACARQHLPCSEKVLASHNPDATNTTPLAPAGHHPSTTQASSSFGRTDEPFQPRTDWSSTLSSLEVLDIRPLVDLLKLNQPLPRSVQAINYLEIVTARIEADPRYENNPHLLWAHSTREFSDQIARATSDQPRELQPQQLETTQQQASKQNEVATPRVQPDRNAPFWQQAAGPSQPLSQRDVGTPNTPIDDHTMRLRLVEPPETPYPREDGAGGILVHGRRTEDSGTIGVEGTVGVEDDAPVGVAENQVEGADEEDLWSFQPWLGGE